MPQKNSWSDIAVDLVDVAMGRKPAELVIRNGRLVNVYSGEILPGIDIAAWGGRIAYVGENAQHTIGPDTNVIDAENRYLIPGLCDAHMHVESGMVTVTEFARAVIPHGTTSMFIDPHEIANVLGLPGVRLDARRSGRSADSCLCTNAKLCAQRAWFRNSRGHPWAPRCCRSDDLAWHYWLGRNDEFPRCVYWGW